MKKEWIKGYMLTVMSWCCWTKPSLSAALLCRVLSLTGFASLSSSCCFTVAGDDKQSLAWRRKEKKKKKERKKERKKAGRRKEGIKTKSIEMEGDRTDLRFVSLY